MQSTNKIESWLSELAKSDDKICLHLIIYTTNKQTGKWHAIREYEYMGVGTLPKILCLAKLWRSHCQMLML